MPREPLSHHDPRYSLEVHGREGSRDHNVTARLEVATSGDAAISIDAPGAGNATLHIPRGSPLYVELRELFMGDGEG